MMSTLASPATITVTVFGVAALVTLGVGIYWLFNKRARLRDIAEMRAKLDELEPSDPEYGAVRALYTSMVLDAERWGYFAGEAGSGGHASSADHGGSDHVGDAGGGGHAH
ncbi:hypothetical protein UNPF46_33425 [Bradyrhizobium sp. UNPF46]|uniref:hypothetical protein n=1 Tax=Bradyrhizobium sp. UNPF46 TaxID=1141168 RepID=UPI0011519E99|nr:hypothetical protein [Bradyrhizobium sp. UNPF46]TQF26530.1 hypothetical protein UNPF46_33425 [Bradyrhizobium sp. UNPF46]